MRIACFVLLLLGACSATRFTDHAYDRLANGTEYHVEDRGTGFNLYVYYTKWQFFGNRPKVAAEGKKEMQKLAYNLAAQRGRAIKPLNEARMEEDVGRDFWAVTSWSCMAPFDYDLTEKKP